MRRPHAPARARTGSKLGNGEGNIRLRADGRHKARLTIDGVSRSFYGRTRDEAARKLTEAQHRRHQGLPQVKRAPKLGDYLTHCLETVIKVENSHNTYTSYGRLITNHLLPSPLASKPLTEVQTPHSRSLLAEKRAAGPTIVVPRLSGE